MLEMIEAENLQTLSKQKEKMRERERERMCMYFSVWMETEINVPSLDSPELRLY